MIPDRCKEMSSCMHGSIIWNCMVLIHSDSPALFIAGTPRGGCTSMLEYVSDFEGANFEQEN